MGRGDKKTKKGKIFKGSYGVVRAKKKSIENVIAEKQKKEIKPKKKTTKKKTAK